MFLKWKTGMCENTKDAKESKVFVSFQGSAEVEVLRGFRVEMRFPAMIVMDEILATIKIRDRKSLKNVRFFPYTHKKQQ